MRKTLFSVVVSALLLCGCDNDIQEVNDNNEITTQDESTTATNATTATTETVDQNNEIKKGIGVGANFYNVRRDEETQKIKYSTILDEHITYEGGDLELGVSLFIDVPNLQNEKIQAVAMLAIDGQLVPFSIEGGENAVTHKIELENRESKKKLINFIPSMIEKDETAELAIIVVPMLESYVNVPDEVAVIKYNKSILSTVEKTDKNQIKYCSDGYYFDTAKNVYGKELYEICPYNGAVQNYILEDKEGKWNYMSEYGKGKLIVLLFCDGELYNGFDGSYGLVIDKTEKTLVHKQIDMSKLSEGIHKIFAVVLPYDENGELDRICKSLAGEVNISK